MLRQDELAFIKAISSLQVSPALLRELRLALASRKKRKTAVSAGSRSTAHGGGPKASSQLAGKRKANELISSGDSMEPANRRPAPGTLSAPLPAFCFSHGRTGCHRQPATRSVRERSDVCGHIGRSRRPAAAKWAAEAHSHGFGPVRIHCLNRDCKYAHV
jgi:hypothetical protein